MYRAVQGRYRGDGWKVRLNKVVAALGLVAAVFVGSAGTGSAAPADREVTPAAPAKKDAAPHRADGKQSKRSVDVQTTGGNSFLEVNPSNQLVYWSRPSTTAGYTPQVRGVGWGTARLITSLDANRFLEVKSDGRLSLWTWTGSYNEQVIGTGWGNTRLLSGMDSGSFLEVNNQGKLVFWWLEGTALFPEQIGQGWQNSKHIAALANLDFMEIEQNGNLSEWYWTVDERLEEFVADDTGFFSVVRLITGLSPTSWLYIRSDNGRLIEFRVDPDTQTWQPFEVGRGWQGSRLIG
jgi:hypothetical protein